MHTRQQLRLAFSHIVDVVHVRIERSVKTVPAEDDCQGQDHPEQPSMTFRRHGGYSSKRQAFFGLTHPLLDQMGQENQDEEDGSHQHKGCKKTQIAQRRCIEWYQTGEGTYSRDVSYQQRRDHLLQHLTDSTAMIRVGNEMKGIIDGYTYDN